MENKSQIVSVLRKSHFNAAHRLFNPEWSDEMNQKVFGVCNNPNYHGHNYDLIVKVSGPIDPKTGYVIDMKILQDMIDEYIIARFDHKNLNLDTEEFKSLNPTAENIAVVIWNILREQIDPEMDLHITLFETARNIVEYGGPSA
jgi:6-pyruvoyltetrahydropterin/6-carboxytetrahydropterin synthase